MGGYTSLVQRLSPMFPAGVAGIALLLLRVWVAARLVMLAFPEGYLTSPVWQFVCLIVVAAFVCLGLFTPVACAVCSLIEIAALFGTHGIKVMDSVLAILITLSLAILGPGTSSIDARMYGRHVIFPRGK